MRIFCADIETDGLDATKIWVKSVAELDISTMKERTKYNVVTYDNMRHLMAIKDAYWVYHNGVAFDKPMLEKLLDCKMEGIIIDTLILSWYLYPKQMKHGLGYWGEQLGTEKVVVEADSWKGINYMENKLIDSCEKEGISNLDPTTLGMYEQVLKKKMDHLKLMCHRCEEDVVIQVKLWQQIYKHMMLLYKEPKEIFRVCEYLSYKMHAAYLASVSKWKLDKELCLKTNDEFSNMFDKAKKSLESAMPDVPIFKKKTRPAKPYKIDGTMSKIGEKWKELTVRTGYPFDYLGEIEVQEGETPPNAASHVQIKSWLYKLGWKPSTYEFKRDKETNKTKKIPQVRVKDTGELCISVSKLIKKEPSIKFLQDMGIVSHRKSITTGWLKKEVDGFLVAGIQGVTNTMRFKHKTIVNVPSVRKPYGELIRSLLVAREGMLLCGSDLSSLESRIQSHYMYPYDKEYVEELDTEDYDPHVTIAIQAGLMSEEEGAFYKWYKKSH